MTSPPDPPLYQHNPDQLGHRRPVFPHPLLKCSIKIQEQKWETISVSRFGDCLLAPGFENYARFREVAVGGERSDGRDFGMEVGREGVLEVVHYCEEGWGVEGRGRGEFGEIVVEFG